MQQLNASKVELKIIGSVIMTYNSLFPHVSKTLITAAQRVHVLHLELELHSESADLRQTPSKKKHFFRYTEWISSKM